MGGLWFHPFLAAAWCLLLATTPVQVQCGYPSSSSSSNSNSNYTVESYLLPTFDEGVLLYTAVYTHRTQMQMQGNRSLAVMYEQTPYADPSLLESIAESWQFYVEYGNVTARLVLQTFRGTGNSTGSFDALGSVSRDAEATLLWLAKQPWANGVVFRYGSSAMGMAVYLQAQIPPAPVPVPVTVAAPVTAAPPVLVRSAFSWIATDDLYSAMYPQGAYRFELAVAILHFINQTDYEGVFEAHEAPSGWWDRSRLANYSNVQWPTIHMAGWYDPFVRGQLRAYRGHQYESAPMVRGTNVLLVNPQGHCFTGGQFPWSDDEQAFEYEGLIAGMYLYDAFNASVSPLQFSGALALWRLFTAKVPKVIWWVMGPGYPYNTTGHYPTGADDFPLPKYTGYYLQGGNALSTAPPPEDRYNETYLYDPTHPVPTLGGSTLGVDVPELRALCGPWDQLLLGERGDVKRFTTLTPLPAVLYITGNVTAVLHVTSNATDTDFMAKLVDVYPNGTRLLVTDGAIRMRWRNQQSAVPQPMVPGEVYRVEIDLGPTAFAFPAGHRLGLDITSSNYPKYTANPNNGRNLTDTSAPVVWASNTILFGGPYDSQLVLPVVSEQQVKPLDLWVMMKEKQKKQHPLESESESESDNESPSGIFPRPPGWDQTRAYEEMARAKKRMRFGL